MSHHNSPPSTDTKNNMRSLLEIRKERSSCSSSMAVAEVFLAKTDRIFFLAIVSMDMDKDHLYRSNGFIRLPDGSTLWFSQQANNIAELMDKTKEVSERLTKVYGGTLLRERVFCKDGTNNSNVV